MPHDLIDEALLAQLDLEAEMLGRGRDRFRTALSKAAGRNQAADVGYRKSLLSQGVEPVAKAIRDFIEAKGPGRNHAAIPLMKPLEAEHLAFFALKALLSEVSGYAPSQTRIAYKLGAWVEDEIKLRAFEDRHAGLLRHVNQRLKSRSANDKFRRSSLIAAMANVGEENIVPAWDRRERVLVGLSLTQIAIEITGWWEVVLIPDGRHNTRRAVRLTPEVLKVIDDKNAKLAELYPDFLPTIIPPKPWTGPRSGGYYTPPARSLALVKSTFRGFIRDTLPSLTPEAIPEVYAAVNTIQATPWAVNTRILAVLREAWDRDIRIGMPGRDDDPLPARGEDLDEHAAEAWRREARDTHNKNAKRRTKRLQWIKLLQLADKFAGHERFYFPYNLDFRGRAYAIPSIMNPQSFDAAKACLQFADGKPLGDDVAAGWLAIHGANLWGHDKVSLEDRIRWVEGHLNEIVAATYDPLGNQWWAEADKPWQFLAWCFEWTGFLEQGYDFVSHIPIALDGTCNGIQHFSAMLRDEVGGRAVNLTRANRPSDIYQTVADRVVEIIKIDPSPDAPRLLQWGQIDRKITKRPVMVLPYGGTFMSCREYVKEAMIEKGADAYFGDGCFKAAVEYLAKAVWQAISDVVIGAREAMKWLQGVTRIVSKKNRPITWVTPVGLPIVQAYPNYSAERLETILAGGIRIRFSLAQEKQELNKKKQTNSVSPNFVHSLDAAALMLTVNMARANGITDFAMIHDSYGTLAADTHALSQCLRHAFVEMYQDHDVLGDFLQAAVKELDEKEREQLPPMPALGTLDISEVLHSDFFFC